MVIDGRQQARALLVVQWPVAAEDPDARVVWELIEIDESHASIYSARLAMTLRGSM
jgi:hypothetical protein